MFALPFSTHAATTSYTCKYNLTATQNGLSDEEFSLQFIHDAVSKKAYMIGNLGSTEVIVVPNNAGISFVEITDVGNVMSTSINTSGKSVHSRHTIWDGENMQPSQYYGQCSAK